MTLAKPLTLWFIGLHVLNGLLLKGLSGDLSLASLLIYRGLSCLLFAAAIAFCSGQAFFPVEPRIQGIRMFLGGSALACIIAGYRFVDASTVALLGRLDLAFLVLLGAWTGGVYSSRRRMLAGISVVIAVAYVLYEAETSTALGALLAVVGALLVSISYLVLRSSVRDESIPALTLSPALALVLIGCTSRLIEGGTDDIPWIVWLLLFLAGAVMYLIYDATVRLYRMFDVAAAEFPTVLAALILVPLESAVFGTMPSAQYLVFFTMMASSFGLLIFAGRQIQTRRSSRECEGGT